MNRKKAFLIWFTGLSGSGKSTLARQLCNALHAKNIASYVLDADEIRKGLNADLGFAPEDRKENIRRVGQVAKLMVDAGLVTIAAFISPYREDRNKVRKLFPVGQFIEIYLNCPLAVCEKRDPKGLYQKARSGKLPEFTGISAPYEPPQSPELTIKTDQISVTTAVQLILQHLPVPLCKGDDRG